MSKRDKLGEPNQLASEVRWRFRDPVVVILLLAGFFDGISGNPIHSILLFGAATAIAHGPDATVATTGGALGGSADRRRSVVPVAVAMGLVFAFVVGGFGRYSWSATSFVVVVAGTGVVIAWRGPLRGAPTAVRPDPLGARAWTALFVVLGLWELTQLLLQPSLTQGSQRHPTFSVLMDPVLASHVGRSVSLCFWLALGWFLLDR